VSDLIPAEQIQQLTGYKRPADQLRELLRQGFYRARLAPVTGHVVLERPHYDAVAQGLGGSVNAANQPMLRKHRQASR
jgi:hypothetical protein